MTEVHDGHADLADLAAGQRRRRGRSRSGSGRSKAIDRPVWPLARLVRYSSLDARAVECPEYVRIIHGRSGSGSQGAPWRQWSRGSRSAHKRVRRSQRHRASHQLEVASAAGSRPHRACARWSVAHCTSSTRPSPSPSPSRSSSTSATSATFDASARRWNIDSPANRPADADAVQATDQRRRRRTPRRCAPTRLRADRCTRATIAAVIHPPERRTRAHVRDHLGEARCRRAPRSAGTTAAATGRRAVRRAG